MTFHPHPRFMISPNQAPPLLTTLKEKEQFLPDFFNGQVLVLDFDEKMMNLEAEDFVQQVLVDKLQMRKLIVGYNHAIGRKRRGDVDCLRKLSNELGFDFEVVDPVTSNGKRISSSQIRQLMQDQDFERAVEMLGHNYAITGRVVRGIGLGMKIGYPTANVEYGQGKLLPHAGVYSCEARVRGERYVGMMFIGKNHFNPDSRIAVEANLFDFDQDIYDQEISLYPRHFVREGEKFNSIDELVKQLKLDKLQVMNIIEKEKENADRQRGKGAGYCSQSSA